MSDVQTAAEAVPVVYATEGTGPLLEREYSAVIEGAGCTPDALMKQVRERFATFAPVETACFGRSEGCSGPLKVGDGLEIRIALLGRCAVRVVHIDERSLTLRTLKGHPEAGRITFGADRDATGHTVFRILSRTRASGLVSYLGYLTLGKQMQSRCWIKFIAGVASGSGGRINGRVRVRTRHIEEGPGDRPGSEETPTFACGGV